jgi:hypothetical protein
MIHRSARILGILFCFFLLWTAIGHAQQVHLVYKFKVGDINRYEETTQSDMTSDMMPAGGQKVFNEMYTTQKVETVNADGSAEIIRTIDSVNTLLNGQPFSNPQTRSLVGLPMRVTVATTGKMLDARPVRDTADATVNQAVDILRKQLLADPGYPATTIILNEPWQDSTSFSQASQMGSITTNIKYSTRLTGVDKISDIDVNVLERTVDVSGQIGDSVGTLKGNGKGNIYFSGILGKETMSTMTIDQTMNMLTPQGPFSMTMKISTKRELLK